MWFDVDQEELLRLLLRLHQRIEGQAMPELESRSCSRCLINDVDDSNAVYPPNDQMQGGQRARDVRWRAVWCLLARGESRKEAVGLAASRQARPAPQARANERHGRLPAGKGAFNCPATATISDRSTTFSSRLTATVCQVTTDLPLRPFDIAHKTTSCLSAKATPPTLQRRFSQLTTLPVFGA